MKIYWKGLRVWEVQLRDSCVNLIRADAGLDPAGGTNCSDSANSWEREIPEHIVWIWEREIAPKFLTIEAANVVALFTEIVLKETGLWSKLYAHFQFYWVWDDFYIKVRNCLYKPGVQQRVLDLRWKLRGVQPW